MLRPASDFKGLTIAAVDGDLGSVADLYFDDLRWTVRYLVVDTGTWLPGRQVLISPLSVREGAGKILVDLTQGQVEDSPPGYYWEGPYRWGLLAYPGMPPVPTAPVPADGIAAEAAARERETALGDPSLRSARDVTGDYIVALDGDIGHVVGHPLSGRGHAQLVARQEGGPLAGIDQDRELAGFAGSRRSAAGRDRDRARVRSGPAARSRLRDPPPRAPQPAEVLGVGGTLTPRSRDGHTERVTGKKVPAPPPAGRGALLRTRRVAPSSGPIARASGQSTGWHMACSRAWTPWTARIRARSPPSISSSSTTRTRP
jgi:hypothetical protein